MLWVLVGIIYIYGIHAVTENLDAASSDESNRILTIDPFLDSYNYATPDNNLLDLNASANALPEPAALAAPERSIYDSGYTKTANFIMNTALKLPPHILPTLEELDGSKVPDHATHRSHVGVYLPDKQQNVGLYLPVPKSTLKRSQEDPAMGRRKRKGNKRIRTRQRQIAPKEYQNRIKEHLSINNRISNEITTERYHQLYSNKLQNSKIASKQRNRKNKRKRTKTGASIIPKNSIAGRLFRFGAQNAKAFTLRRRQTQRNGSVRREPTARPRRIKHTKQPWKHGQKPPYGHTPKFPPVNLQKDYLALRENSNAQDNSINAESNSGFQRTPSRRPQRVEPKEDYDSYDSYGGHPYSFEPADFKLPWSNYDTSVSKSIEETRNKYLDFDSAEEDSYNEYYEKETGNIPYSAEDYRPPTSNKNHVRPDYEDFTYSSERKPKRQVSTISPPVVRPGKLQSHRHQKRRRPYNHIKMDTGISKYVPKMVKTVLAKSFLKNPRPYLIRLEEENGKKKKRRKRKHQNRFLARRYTTTTQSYSDFDNNIDRKDVNNGNSKISDSDENISLVNGLLINNQIADPFDLYDDVVSKEYDVPSYEKEVSHDYKPPTTESSKTFEFEKVLYANPGYETHKNTHEKSVTIINDKLDQYQVNDVKKEGDFYKELLKLYEQDRTAAYRPTSVTSSSSFGTRTRFEEDKTTTNKTPFTKDSKPFIDYLQRLSILSGEDYYDDGKMEIDLNSSNETTLCFCCRGHFSNDIYDTSNAAGNAYGANQLLFTKKRSRQKRAIKIPDPLKSKLVYENMDILEQSLDCHHQEPIIVKISSRYLDKNHPISRLSFNSNNDDAGRRRNMNHRDEKKDIYYVPTKRKSGRYSKSQNRKIGLQYSSSNVSPIITNEAKLEKGKSKTKNKGYYDPKQLSFTFTTPSSIARRYLRYRDKDIVAKKSFSVNESDNYRSIVKPYKDSVTKYTKDNVESRAINNDYYNVIDVYNNNEDIVVPSTTLANNSLPPSLSSLSIIENSMHKETTPYNSNSTPKSTQSPASTQSTRKTSLIDPLGLSIFRLLRG